ncbi:MAG: DUF3106 domain-containing protein [Betaproteobacteria bacterium]
MRKALARGALFAGLLLLWASAWAQAGSRPSWSELTNAQREALAPLARDWAALDADRKRKWLEVAAKYPNLSPQGKQRMHERMSEFARLTPEQKATARENFRRAYEVPAEQRQATVQKFQELPEDKKRELANRAAGKAETPRRPTADSKVKPAQPPARTEPQKE